MDSVEEIMFNATGSHIGGVGDANHSLTYNYTEPFSGLNTTPTTSTTTTTEFGPPDIPQEAWLQVIKSIGLGIIIFATVIGNSLVCIAVAIVRRLQSPSNLLIVSLAVSDLLVAALVMPFSAMVEVLGYWTLNDTICDLYTSLDVIMCTASILNLCMISVDRYYVITRPLQYAIKRTPRRMGIMVAGVWLTSALVSIPPLFGWKTPRGAYECTISQEIGYQIYATLFAFYLPLIIMIVVYFRIWRVSSRLQKKEQRSKLGSLDRGNELLSSTTKSARSSGASDHLNIPNGLRNGVSDTDDASTEMLSRKSMKRRFTLKSLISRTSKSTAGNSSRERKATKTLGIIMGGFTLCWLPFFILAVIRPFVHHTAIPAWLSSSLMWLGYFNSFMNPVIYARFNRDFRTPFKEILCFRCRGINVRLRSESYIDQYGPDPHIHQHHRDRDRESLKPTHDSIVRYNSQGKTIVHVGNGNTNVGESKI